MIQATKGANINEAKIVFFIDNDNSWSTVKISYIVSARKDLIVGSFLVDTLSLQGRSQSKVELDYIIADWAPANRAYKTFGAIAGLRTSASMVPTLKVAIPRINPRTGRMSLSVDLDTTVLFEYIYVSYVLWVNSPTLIGTFVVVTSPTKFLYTGFAEINRNNFIYRGIGFTREITRGMIACEGNRCVSACMILQTCIQANGLIANNKCFLCGTNQIYQDSQCKGITCPENMTLVGRNCVCKPTYHLISPNVCSPCPVNSHWNVDKCRCDEGFYSLQTKCVKCPAESTFDLETRSCVCNTGFTWFENSCIACGENQIFNLVSKSCLCVEGFERLNNNCVKKCAANQVRQGETCACKSGLRRVGEECLACPAESVYIAQVNRCICRPGFFLYNNTCIVCGTNEGWSYVSNRCECLNSFNRIDNKCQKCGQNSFWDGQECKCQTGFNRVDNLSCIRCDRFKEWNGTACMCGPSFMIIRGACYCPLNSRFVTDKCVCNSGWMMSDRKCVPLLKACQAN